MLRLCSVSDLRSVAGAAGAVGGVVVVLLARPVLEAAGQPQPAHILRGPRRRNGIRGVPIAFAFGLATVGYLALTTSTPMWSSLAAWTRACAHLILLAVPLFVFLGC